MSFLHPERLLLLAGVVVLAVAYVAVWLRRSQAIARYTQPHLHDRLAPDRRRGLKRHVAPALALGALSLVLVSAAQPTRDERVPREKGVVVLAIDTSLSMQATDISPTRLEAAVDGATDFVDELPEGIEVGLVSFDSEARLLVSPTTDHESVQAAIGTLTTNARTATGEGVFTSLDAVQAALADETGADGEAIPAAIVLLSDGVETVGRSVDSATQAAVDAKVPVSTIAYGTPTGTVSIEGDTIPVPADTQTMSAVADATGGTYFEATSAGQLQDVYADIQTTIGYETEPREVGRALIGGAFVLLLGAGGIAVLTSARPL
ncbi:VWA domain-containing protein [Aquihabitans daechungensis]|uniref:VWA domain-containing protein n=1 Tax=Aquihabitans daechungensis TaxID=1052257 RepID=UPI003B9E36CD